MSDFIQAIDVISKLLPQIKSLTGARRREYFNEIIVPMFKAFEDVHDFYHHLIIQTREGIVKVGWSRNKLVLMPQDSPLTKKQLISLGRLRDSFGKKRQKDERLRDSLRQDARQLLMRISWEEEQVFLTALGDYFLGDDRIPLTPHESALQVRHILDRGGDSYWRTPSSEIYFELCESTDLSEVLVFLDKMRHSLNERYMNVRAAFKGVHHVVIERT